jgi:hypothetical protein
MKRLRIFVAPSLWLACAVCLPAAAQAPAASATPAAVCTSPAEFSTAQLYGQWQLVLWTESGSPDRPASTGTLRFERHPEYPGSVRGQLQRSGAQTPGSGAVQALVSGDAIDGAFNLDESADGVAMDAVWEGAPASCGREIRGLRRPAEGQPNAGPAMNFLLKKAPGWG